MPAACLLLEPKSFRQFKATIVVHSCSGVIVLEDEHSVTAYCRWQGAVAVTLLSPSERAGSPSG
jgi:hypothetical protein